MGSVFIWLIYYQRAAATFISLEFKSNYYNDLSIKPLITQIRLSSLETAFHHASTRDTIHLLFPLSFNTGSSSKT